MSNCCGGFALEALMNVFVKKIEGNPQIIGGLSVKNLMNEWYKLYLQS